MTGRLCVCVPVEFQTRRRVFPQSSDPNGASEGESVWINIRNNYS